MKAIISTKIPGAPGLQVRKVPKPAPRRGEVLLRVLRSSVTAGDVALGKIPRWVLGILGFIFGFKAMKIPGVEFAGVVESLGPGTSGFRAGDPVLGTATGLAYGGNAEYLCVPVRRKSGVLVPKPQGLDWDLAGVLPVGAMTAQDLLARAGSLQGKTVLVYGAAGAVGNAAVQIAGILGARVTAVCSAKNLETVKAWGPEAVLAYDGSPGLEGLGPFDVVFDAVGKLSRAQVKRLRAPGGKALNTWSPTKESEKALNQAIQWVLEGKFTPHISQVFPLDRVGEAHALVESGRKVGNVLIRIRED